MKVLLILLCTPDQKSKYHDNINPRNKNQKGIHFTAVCGGHTKSLHSQRRLLTPDSKRRLKKSGPVCGATLKAINDTAARGGQGGREELLCHLPANCAAGRLSIPVSQTGSVPAACHSQRRSHVARADAALLSSWWYSVDAGVGKVALNGSPPGQNNADELFKWKKTLLHHLSRCSCHCKYHWQRHVKIYYF